MSADTAALHKGVVLDLRSMQTASRGLDVIERQLLAHIAALREQPGRPTIIGYRSPLLPEPDAAVLALCDRVIDTVNTGLDAGVLLVSDTSALLPALARIAGGNRLKVAAMVDERAFHPPEAAPTTAIDVILVPGGGKGSAHTLARRWRDARIEPIDWHPPFFASSQAKPDPIEEVALAQLLRSNEPYLVLAPELGKQQIAAIAAARAEALRLTGQAPRLLSLRSRRLPPRIAPLPLGMARSIVQFGDVLELPALSEAAAAALFLNARAVLLDGAAACVEYGTGEVASAGGRSIVLDPAMLLGAETIDRNAPDALSRMMIDLSAEAAPAEEPDAPKAPAPFPWHLLAGDPTSRQPTERPTLALVAPYPTTEFGVSIYTRDTGTALAAIAVVDLVTQKPVQMVDRLPLRDVRHPDRLTDPLRYDEVIHVLYNHPDAAPAYHSLMRNGGVAIVHDAQLLDLAYHVMGTAGLQAHMERVLRRPVTKKEFDNWLVHKRDLPSAFFDDIVEKSTRLIVHSPTARKYLSDTYGIDCVYIPVAIQHGISEAALEPEQRRIAKRRCGMHPARISIGSFGAVQPVKGDRQLLHIVRYLLDWGHDIEFHFVGHCDPERKASLIQSAETLMIADRVHFATDISEDMYLNYLSAMDMSVQLRSIGMGQLSGALLDCVAASLPTVSITGLAESIEAPSFVYRVPDVTSPLLVADAIVKLINDLPKISRPHPEWRDYVEDRSFARYAERLVNAIR
jgi:glycosyltransferase involved in cell wall biosynthesis